MNKKDFTFFWHAPSPFSQWHPSLFTHKGIQFISGEQFMMFSKAKLFGDDKVADKILRYNDSLLAKDFISRNIEASGIINDKNNLRTWTNIQKKFKSLGKEVKNFNEEKWKEKRIFIVTVGNREKYLQNEKLMTALLNTGDTIICETNPFDKVWACGLRDTDPRTLEPEQWEGLNLLGQILNNLRDKFCYDLTNKESSKIKSKL